MWLMKAPASYFEEGRMVSGTVFNLTITNGYVLVDKQYWYKFLKDRYFIDVTPESLKTVKPHKIDKLIAVRWGGYGDIIMCLPALQHLKLEYPDLKIVMAGMDKHAAILKNHPAVSAILLPPAHQIGNIISEYDLAFDLSGIIPCNPEADWKNAYDLHLEWFGINPDDVEEEQKVPDIVIEPVNEAKLAEVLEEKGITGDDYIIMFHPKSSTEMRDLPFNIAREAITSLAFKHPDKKIIVTDMQGPVRNNERFVCNKCKTEQIINIKKNVEYTAPIQHVCPECESVINLVPPTYKGKVSGQRVVWHVLPDNVFFPKLSFDLFCTLIGRSKLVITVDSSPLHIAGGLNIPTLGIFSSFDGDLRARYFPNTTWIQQPFRCAPCFMHNTICPRFRTEKRLFSPCMDSIQPDLIVSRAEEVIKAIQEKEEEILSVPTETKEDEETFVAMPLLLNLEKPLQTVSPDKENVTCFACKGNDVTLGYRKGNFAYWKCNTCGSYFIFPKPTPEYLAENYQDSDYNIIFQEMEGIKKTAHIITTMFGATFDFKGKMLEIGSNIGWFAAEAKRLGWDITGVEISKASVAECRKKGLAKNIICGSIEDGDIFAKVQEKGPFDVIIIHNTIEHCIDPISLLQICKSVANPGTVFSVSTPCTDMWDGKNIWGHINPFFAGEHINLLSKDGMAKLCDRIGLKIRKVEDFEASNECWYMLELESSQIVEKSV